TSTKTRSASSSPASSRSPPPASSIIGSLKVEIYFGSSVYGAFHATCRIYSFLIYATSYSLRSKGVGKRPIRRTYHTARQTAHSAGIDIYLAVYGLMCRSVLRKYCYPYRL